MITLLFLCYMKIFKYFMTTTLIVLLLSSCSSLRINEAAANDHTVAIEAINQIKKSGIVVIFPTEHKKEKALIKFAETNSSIQEDIDELRIQRAKRLEIWQTTQKEYSFSEISIVPDSLLKTYSINPNEAMIIGQDGELTEAQLGDIYVLYMDYGGFEIKRNGQFLPNPFPNKVQPAWGSSIKDFLGVQSEEKSINRFFTELQSQLNNFYGLSLNQGN